tara:strand:- start:1281 stop:1547 length:267 start_codon:yes stop_codon:yes gene_type:complete
MITPKNLIRHELIGLVVEVVGAKNPCQVGIKGKVVDETRHTLLVATSNGEKRLMKRCVVIRVKLKSQRVEVDGERLVGKPEERIKKWK